MLRPPALLRPLRLAFTAACALLAGCAVEGSSDAPEVELEAVACASAALAPSVLGDRETLDRVIDDYTPHAKERRVAAAYWLVLIDSERRGEADHALLTGGFEAFFRQLGTKYESLDTSACGAAPHAADPTDTGATCSEAGVPEASGLLTLALEVKAGPSRPVSRLVEDPVIAQTIEALHERLGPEGLEAWRGFSSLDVLSDAVGNDDAGEILRRVGTALLPSDEGESSDETSEDLAEVTAVVGGVVTAAVLRPTLLALRSQYDACQALREDAAD